MKALKNQVRNPNQLEQNDQAKDLPNSLVQKMEEILGERQQGHVTERHQKIRQELHRNTKRKASTELNSKQLAQNILSQMKQKPNAA